MTYDQQPLTPKLSGLALEYRIVQLYSRDRGQREASLAFDVGQGTQDLGFRNEVPILFTCQPAVKVTVDVLDVDGKPTTGQFVIRDTQGRCVSGPIATARARFLFPSADLSAQRRIRRASARRLRIHLHPRSGIPDSRSER